MPSSSELHVQQHFKDAIKSHFDCYCFFVIFFFFPEAPIVLVTSEHLRTGKEYDAALIWIEDVTKDSVKVCLREMQNFDGRHQDITVVRYKFLRKLEHHCLHNL